MDHSQLSSQAWQRGVQPNRWDWLILPLIIALIILMAFGASQMATPYHIGTPLAISLEPSYLPYYLLRTTLRMLMALGLSLLFSFAFAVIAARYRMAEKVMVPALDILQSIPVLGFLSITVTGFIALFPGNLLGVECAAIFAIFTSQAWNMAFSLYQSMRTVPSELKEAARIFHLSTWQRFWRLELPFAMPGLLWNMMMSMSGGWFFVVASEAISVSNQNIKLPGIGSYIALAISQQNMNAIGWAILAMLIGILIYDQLLFRPLIAWANKFKFEQSSSEDEPQSWLLTLMRRTNAVQNFSHWAVAFLERGLLLFKKPYDGTSILARPKAINPKAERVGDAIIAALALFACWKIAVFVHAEVGWHEVGRVFWLGCLTMLRVSVLIVLASIVWVPIGVWVGLNPKYAARLQPVAQFMAAFPANLMFPIVVLGLVKFKLNPEIWLSPLMVFGTQWYILFNVIAGASSIPGELRYAADNLGLSRWLRWKRFLLPAIFPSFVTGAITASGGSWNASIVAEYVSWGDTTLTATGLGSYIAEMTATGDFPRIALGISVMCCFVMAFNRFVWRKLYAIAEEKMSY
ncbi:ABC transporter permease subunit [Iodobacter sp. CM08]|uniref:ABC transporter permease n=1 Tax=Iodobacter sp. CM08 TaxID=3085902 RepID=UPI002981A6A8|nr:ABC transporter permease subunit [Iodobacter sp. CM08]MDW5416596.1 ABC transporter permease subunit [Iodobacter sp. CM08]